MTNFMYNFLSKYKNCFDYLSNKYKIFNKVKRNLQNIINLYL